MDTDKIQPTLVAESVINFDNELKQVSAAPESLFTREDLLPTKGAPPVPAPPRARRGEAALGRQLRSASVDAARILAHKVTTVSDNPRDHWRAFVGEFIGTTMFIFLGLALNAAATTARVDPTMVSALVAGGALTALIFSLGHVSGGHLNPSVTLCIVIVRALPGRIGMLYVLSQLLGSLAAAGCFALTTLGSIVDAPEYKTFGLEPKLGLGSAFFVQLMVTSFLCWVVLATGVDSRGGEPRNFLAALPIGIAVAVGVVVAGPLIGASMNPAGSFGVIVVYNMWRYAWLYMAVPQLAAILTALVYKFVFMTHTDGLSALHLIRDTIRGHGNKTDEPEPFV